MDAFNANIQLDRSDLIPEIKKPIKLNSFYKEGRKNQPLYNCEAIKKILSVITKETDSVSIKECELYLPVNKRNISPSDMFSFVKETIIDLSTSEGIKEARKRFAILAYLLSQQPLKKQSEKLILHPGGVSIYVGDFKLPNGSTELVITCWKDDHGHNGAWWFYVIPDDGRYVDAGYWFAFSAELKNLVNYTDKIPA